MSTDEIKKAVAREAALLVQDGMTIGLGSGSTSAHCILSLIERCRLGLNIRAVASSNQSAQLAQKGGIPLIDYNQVEQVDMMLDGADEVDPHNQMIKGRGGALVREKILAEMSRERVIMVDETKLVHQLGKAALPIEMISFGVSATIAHLKRRGYTGSLRRNQDSSLFVTDNHNYIFDIQLNQPSENPREDHALISAIPGVVETGFFFDLVSKLIVGFADGQVVVR